MSSDSVSPSSLSLRTSRLNDGVSRPSSAARSGARTSGERSMIASVCRVHGPVGDAASRRSRRARISASSASVGGRCRNAIRGSSPAQRRPTRNTGRSALTASPRRNASRDAAPARRASSSVIVVSSTGSTEVTSISPTAVRIRVPTTTRGRSQRRKPRSTAPALIPSSSTGRIITPLRLTPPTVNRIHQCMLTIVAIGSAPSCSRPDRHAGRARPAGAQAAAGPRRRRASTCRGAGPTSATCCGCSSATCSSRPSSSFRSAGWATCSAGSGCTTPGFAIFTVALRGSCRSTRSTPKPGRVWLIGWRIVQAVGGSMLTANSAAILTDAFPREQRGMALGINQIAALAGQFLGLVARWAARRDRLAGGVLGERAVRPLRHDLVLPQPARGPARARRARIDWGGNITFAVGTAALLAAITYGIQPYGASATGWGNPLVHGGLSAACAARRRSARSRPRGAIRCSTCRLFRDPCVHRRQPRRAARPPWPAAACSSCSSSGCRASGCRCTGTTSSDTPLWAGIFLLPLTAGFLLAGPAVRSPLRPVRCRGCSPTGGLLLVAASFLGLLALPVDFSYPTFASAAPTRRGTRVRLARTAVLPPGARGARRAPRRDRR